MNNGFLKFATAIALIALTATVTGYTEQTARADENLPDFVIAYADYLLYKDSVLAAEESLPLSQEQVVTGLALERLENDLADFRTYGIFLKGFSEIADWRLQQVYFDSGKKVQIIYFCNYVGGTDLVNEFGESVKSEGSVDYVINEVAIQSFESKSLIFQEKVLGYSESCEN